MTCITILIIALAIWLIRTRYITCPSDKVLVIYGRVDNPNEYGVEILAGGAKFVYPIIQDYAFLDLQEYHFDYSDTLFSKDGVKLELTFDVRYGIANYEPITKYAATRLLGKSRESISDITVDIIRGVVRNSIIEKDIVELAIMRRNDEYISELAMRLAEELGKLGMVVINLKIKGIKDLEGQVATLEKAYLEKRNNLTVEGMESTLAAGELQTVNDAIHQNFLEREKLHQQKLELLVKMKK